MSLPGALFLRGLDKALGNHRRGRASSDGSGGLGGCMKLLGNPTISPEALQQMRGRGGDWLAYQNHAMDSAGLGDLQFLQCGEGRTYQTPPARMPDTAHAIGWKYLLVGKVDLAAGKIVESEK